MRSARNARQKLMGFCYKEGRMAFRAYPWSAGKDQTVIL